MRSALYSGNSTIVVEDRPPTAPGPGEVQIKVAYTGICGTDLHILHGAMDHRVHTPQTIGHEMSGHIAEIGPDVEGFQPGQPVTVMPLAWCGNCPACTAGHEHICHALNFIGIDTPGAMQQRWTVPASIVVPLPEELPLPHAALVEPTAVAVHDVRRSELQPAELAIVIGGGPIGILIALVARSRGAEVVVCEPDPQRRSIASRIGLTAVEPSNVDAGEAGAAVVFEVSGSAAGIASATTLLATRGRLVVVGIHNQPREIDLFRFFWRELTMVGARVYQRADYDAAIELLRRKEIPADALITHIAPLDSAAAAFATLENGGDAMKVLIDCREAP